MSTLSEALSGAVAYWGNAKGGRVQATRARVCVNALAECRGGDIAVASLTVSDAVKLLTWLRTEEYSPESIGAYYASFKRMVALAGHGGLTIKWPKPPPKPRRSKREAITEEAVQGLIEWFRRKGYGTTADLACVLWGTGLRVDREALSGASLRLTQDVEGPYDTLEVTGKGGHERVIPVVDVCARQVLGDPARLKALQAVPYVTHLKRWNKAVEATGVTTAKATPHAVRHAYATRALSKSGGNLALVQSLLGHSDPGTTARYLSMSLDERAAAL